MQKLIAPILIAILTLGVALVGLQSLTIAAPDNQSRGYAEPVWRLLDTNGDGTGSTIITGTYAITSDIFYLQPPVTATYLLDRLIVTIEDDTVITGTLYGSMTITNGVIVRYVGQQGTFTLTGVAVTDNPGWGRYCELSQTSYANTTNQLQAICKFSGGLLRLNGAQSERLEVVVNDDFDELTTHYFWAQGFRE